MFLVIGPLWFVVLCLAIHWLTKPKPHVTRIVTRVVRYPPIRRRKQMPIGIHRSKGGYNAQGWKSP